MKRTNMVNLKGIFFGNLGPRTDARNLTRPELFRSSLIYLVFGLVSVLIVVAVEIVSPTGDIWGPRREWTGETSVIAFFLAMLFSVGALGGIVGSISLFVRALFKRD